DLHWTFAWCATNSDQLQAILQPLIVERRIDDVLLPNSVVLTHYGVIKSGDQCIYWSAALTDWQTGMTVKLEIDYTLTDSLFDGRANYPAGRYHQIIFVAVQE
ncbi:MAG: hypothetical protein M3Q45_05260, partial [Chloroflexota bacterium]|nr:hypothetical protein [Chloroflexota bacterium]